MISKNPKKLTGQQAMQRLNAELMGKYPSEQQRAHAPKKLSGSEAMRRLNKDLGIRQSAEEFRQQAEARRISEAVEAGVQKALQSRAVSSGMTQTPVSTGGNRSLTSLTPDEFFEALKNSTYVTHKPAPTAAALSSKRLADMNKEELAQISPQEFVARWRRGEPQNHSSKTCHSCQGPVMHAAIVTGPEALQRLSNLNLL